MNTTEIFPCEINRQFTYADLKKITNNFRHAMVKGGFGSVFHGYLENGQPVAVKMLSQLSSQGTKEFVTEAQLLTRVHHRNLVSLVGYCKDKNYLALVYEYMPKGSLQEHLNGKASNEVLNWNDRLRIALETANGLAYLHKGCKPPIIHRDVKTSNILLNEKLEAKLADFGLSKTIHDSETHITTAVGGTRGYLDPEYQGTCQLTEKSDVYSFGVVLLELVAGKPAIVNGEENCHIIEWVKIKLGREGISEVVDPRMHDDYDTNSVLKAIDIAMKCSVRELPQRASIIDVVQQLKEALELQIACTSPLNADGQSSSPNMVTSNSYTMSDLSAR